MAHFIRDCMSKTSPRRTSKTPKNLVCMMLLQRVRLADSGNIARFLRYLASHHVYREVEPDVFTNTRISSMLDTLKSSKELMAEYAVAIVPCIILIRHLVLSISTTILWDSLPSRPISELTIPLKSHYAALTSRSVAWMRSPKLRYMPGKI